jgi:hypothetical protein
VTTDPRRAARIAEAVIAECVGVELDVLASFMRVAEAKLAAAESGDVPGSPPTRRNNNAD